MADRDIRHPPTFVGPLAEVCFAPHARDFVHPQEQQEVQTQKGAQASVIAHELS